MFLHVEIFCTKLSVKLKIIRTWEWVKGYKPLQSTLQRLPEVTNPAAMHVLYGFKCQNILM